MKKILMNDRGVALILVILMISIIIAITLQLNMASRSGIYEAANLGHGTRAACIAKSGFCMGEALLSEDKNDLDSLNEDWAEAELLSAGSGALFDTGHFKLHIEDESGRIPINKLVDDTQYNDKIKDLLIRFLSLPEFDLDEQQVRDIVDAVKDWIDEDDETTGFGAEDIYYEGLEDPYACKNAPLDCIEELLMVKGITENLYYGTEETPGVANYVTLYGEGAININTAPDLILKTLSDEITDEMVSDMNEFRRNEENKLSEPAWYKNIPGMTGITIDPGLITVQSNIFRITSTGYLNDIGKRISGVIERNSGGTVKRLSWKVD
ncbi:MAG: type II secretion system minor pseudopilin GspK [Thermodesulfobacteriota bacterium]|nr:type II secretion system minor pseudopilin GspK [Thermodesulfobacteriota bacterium]